MKIRVHTETGSIYELDRDAMTWQRVHKGSRAGDIRKDGEVTNLLEWPEIGVDRILILASPSLVEGCGRLIVTSQVVCAYTV